VISAFRLARFDATAVLQIIKERGLDIPVIVVSRTAGEDVAVSAMKAGVTDYLLEDRLGRLGEALSEALESKKLRDEAVAAEAVLYDVEAPYRTLVEQIPGITYVSERGMDGPFRFVSPRLTQILGFTPEEWMADPAGWADRIHPDDFERVAAEENRLRAQGGSFVQEYRILSKDDRVVWVRDEFVVVEDDASDALLIRGLMVDITERKVAEKMLQESVDALSEANQARRGLLSRLVRAQEEERKMIASDIHDDPIQKITAALMRLDMVLDKHPNLAQDETFSKARDGVSRSIDSLRHLMFELRPYVLDSDGLTAALTLLLGDQSRTGDETSYDLENHLKTEPPENTRVILYRIAHEALVNVRKHAKASRVEIVVDELEGGYSLLVRDDGVGFEVSGHIDSPRGHIGLTSMRERARLTGGRFVIESSPGQGTVVECWVPAGEDDSADGWTAEPLDGTNG
jgi:PAS domain S-box-containing protein